MLPVISAMQKTIGMNIEQNKKGLFDNFRLICSWIRKYHSYNSLEYDEELIKSHIEQAYRGAILAVQEEMK